MADLLNASLPFELFWSHPNETPLPVTFYYFQETTPKTIVNMNQQPISTATPEQGLMITEEMVINKFMHVLKVYGPGEATELIKDYKKVLADYPGWKTTETKLEEILMDYQEEQQKSKEQEQKNMSQMMLFMMSMANQIVVQQPVPNHQEKKAEKPLSEEHIRRCLELLMEIQDSTGKPLFNKNYHWQAVFCILAEKLHFNRNDFEFFDGLMDRIKPDKVNAPYSRSAVKNISQTPYYKPLNEWKFDENIMKKRKPFQRMQEVAEHFKQLLETTPEE